MTIYRVSIWSSLFVDAESIDEAEDIAHDHVIGCLIKPRDFDFDAEEWEEDFEPVNTINAKAYLDKENNNGN